MSKHSKMNKKRNTKRSPRRPKLWLALLTFFEYSQLFYGFIEEVAIVAPLFLFFRHCRYVLVVLVLHSPFSNVGLLLSSLGSSEGAPPTVTVMFLAFYTDVESSRVESSCHRLGETSCFVRNALLCCIE